MIRQTCLDCGRITERTRCPACARKNERRRQDRQWYRIAYQSPEYRHARNNVRRRAGGRCEAILADNQRCPAPGTEAHHDRPLSKASSLAEALQLVADEHHLYWVCAPHNPRGQNQPGRKRLPEPPDPDPVIV